MGNIELCVDVSWKIQSYYCIYVYINMEVTQKLTCNVKTHSYVGHQYTIIRPLHIFPLSLHTITPIIVMIVSACNNIACI